MLASIAATDPDRFVAIQERVRQVVPKVQALRMPRAPVAQTVTEIHYLDGQQVERRAKREMVGNALEAKIAGEWIPGDQLSEGTLLVIALHTILGSERPPKLVLLDDLDRALHPGAQRAASPARRGCGCTFADGGSDDPLPLRARRGANRLRSSGSARRRRPHSRRSAGGRSRVEGLEGIDDRWGVLDLRRRGLVGASVSTFALIAVVEGTSDRRCLGALVGAWQERVDWADQETFELVGLDDSTDYRKLRGWGRRRDAASDRRA